GIAIVPAATDFHYVSRAEGPGGTEVRRIVFGYRVGAKLLTVVRRDAIGRSAGMADESEGHVHQPPSHRNWHGTLRCPPRSAGAGKSRLWKTAISHSAAILRHDETHQPFSIRDVAPVRTLHTCHLPARIHRCHIRLDEFDADDGVVK